MNNKPVLFLDSGMGGLLYCRDFLEKNPGEEVCYIADMKHFPYGQRTKEELVSILISLTEKILKSIDPKIIVLACNTATVSAVDSLRQAFSVPFVGTVPAIKPAAASSVKGKIGVLGTSRTIDDPYNRNPAFADNIEIFGVAAPELVEFVEKRFDEACENEKTEIVKKYIDVFLKEGVDCLVLGCTHFLYLIDQFKKEAAARITVFDSLDGITRRIESILDDNGFALRASNDFCPSHRLMLTEGHDSEVSSAWQKRAQKLGFKLSLLQ